jgi:outer membrane lipoprotein SlyB
MRTPALFLLVAALALLAGCASSMSNSAYERRQARTAHEVQMGVVEHVREVMIEGTKSRVGSTAGAVAGAGAARGYGPVGRVAGAVVGGIAGAATEEGMTRQKGLEITVKLDSGRLLAVTQADDENFSVGDRVRILSGGRGDTRVTH